MTPTLTLTRDSRTLVLPVTMVPFNIPGTLIMFPSFDEERACEFADELTIDELRYCVIECGDTFGARLGVQWRFDGVVTPLAEIESVLRYDGRRIPA